MADMLSPRGSATRRQHRMNVTAASSFILGGALFALGACLAQLEATSLTTVNVTYLTGGAFFSLGGYASMMIAGSGGRGREWYSAVVLFVGTLFFAVSLVAAFAQELTPRQSDGWIWFPDITGCICFLAGIAPSSVPPPTRPSTSAS